MSMDRYRFVQPAPTVRPPLTASPPPVSPKHKSKREQVAVACNLCRKHKSKCDGARPVCSACESKQLGCVYSAGHNVLPFAALKQKFAELQLENDNLNELFSMLKVRPEKEALGILRRVRSSNDLSETLKLVKDGDLFVSQAFNMAGD